MEYGSRNEETLKPSGEEEYQRFMGFPASLGPWRNAPDFDEFRRKRPDDA
jgi:hypothetical protein